MSEIPTAKRKPEVPPIQLEEPRAYTEAEVRQKFISQVRLIATYNARQAPTVEAACHSTAYDILCLLDGMTLGMPFIAMMACPHEDDEEYNKKLGHNWVADETMLTAGEEFWHEMYYEKEEEEKEE